MKKSERLSAGILSITESERARARARLLEHFEHVADNAEPPMPDDEILEEVKAARAELAREAARRR